MEDDDDDDDLFQTIEKSFKFLLHVEIVVDRCRYFQILSKFDERETGEYISRIWKPTTPESSFTFNFNFSPIKFYSILLFFLSFFFFSIEQPLIDNPIKKDPRVRSIF